MGQEDNNDKIKASEDNYLPKSESLVRTICLVRLFCFAGWIGGMIFATIQIFLACEELLPLQRNPVLHPGYFTQILNRGRDSSDHEWDIFSSLFINRLIYWYAAYLILAKVVENSYFISIVSPMISFLFWGSTIGTFLTTLLIFQPLTYWFLMKFRSKTLVWVFTIGMVIHLSSSHLEVTLMGSDEESKFYFVIAAGWNYCRCISFVFEYWDRPGNEADSVGGLWAAICYCFYFPLTITGPLILFDHYEKHIYRSRSKRDNKMVFKTNWAMVASISRVILIAVLLEFIMHYFYVRPLAMSDKAVQKVNLWVICGSVYWIGQIFTLKYQVLYGIPSFVAEVEGVPMHRLPRCPGYIHRYSVLWKDFDRGLYYFLIRYIYIPIGNYTQKIRINNDIGKLLASTATFTYIYVWHGTSFYIFVWTSLNFLGITIERIGSCIKRKVDKKWNVKQIVWDFVIEPVVTVPLVGMSQLNSSIFCESLETATGLAKRLWKEMGYCYAFVFLYFLTHVAVTLRTWHQFKEQLKLRPKKL